MNERSTPETDTPRSGFSQTRELTSEEWFALYEKTKRERDEARERLHKVLKVLDDYEQSIKNPSSPFWDAFKKWFTSEGAK